MIKKLKINEANKLVKEEINDESTVRDQLDDLISGMSEWERFDLWNMYCEEVNYYEDEIHQMSEVDDLFGSVSEFIEHIDSDFNSAHRYFVTTVYGYLETFDYIEDKANWDEVIDYIIDNETDLGDRDIADILEADAELEDKEDEEDEE